MALTVLQGEARMRFELYPWLFVLGVLHHFRPAAHHCGHHCYLHLCVSLSFSQPGFLLGCPWRGGSQLEADDHRMTPFLASSVSQGTSQRICEEQCGCVLRVLVSAGCCCWEGRGQEAADQLCVGQNYALEERASQKLCQSPGRGRRATEE